MTAVNGAHVVRATLESRWVENPMMGWVEEAGSSYPSEMGAEVRMQFFTTDSTVEL